MWSVFGRASGSKMAASSRAAAFPLVFTMAPTIVRGRSSKARLNRTSRLPRGHPLNQGLQPEAVSSIVPVDLGIINLKF
jgi:hypothetical protein